MASKLIVGLGNPGKAYENTRHNVGFRIVEEIARQKEIVWRKKLILKAKEAKGEGFYLLEPQNYMNLSGPVVAKMMKKHGISTEHLLVIVDDAALPFGKIRLKSHSGAGGHNGLRSIEACLQTNAYARLRIGVGGSGEGDLASHVLASFTPQEEALLPEIVDRAAGIAEIWFTEGLTSAMNHTVGSSQPEKNQ